MSDKILIKRYASRRLYNTNSSEYVTLDEVADLIRDGKDVEIRDRKTDQDLTRQYLLQIITEQQGSGENMLPINLLTGLVRSYNSSSQNLLPEFLSRSYDAFVTQQTNMLEQLSGGLGAGMGFGDPAEWQKTYGGIYGQMMQAFMPGQTEAEPAAEPKAEPASDEIAEIKQQLAALQQKLADL
ncbi:MAG: polyhydroxyalkanoate synthesis repressor PhaR [Rhodobacterales bacterium]|nr:MAG: polyhydroxyalkanoate synthesis repressor PhaR [Rhodobacterales bacterium]